MDFRLSEEQEMMRRMARDFADNEIVPYAQEWDKNNEFPEATIKKMFDLGLMTIGVPAEYGGAGLDFVAQNVVVEEIARGDAGLCVTMAANTLLGPDPVLIAGTHEQKLWWYGLQNEGVLSAFCLTEPEPGRTRRTLYQVCQGQHYYILNGTKQFISNGGVADYIPFCHA